MPRRYTLEEAPRDATFVKRRENSTGPQTANTMSNAIYNALMYFTHISPDYPKNKYKPTIAKNKNEDYYQIPGLNNDVKRNLSLKYGNTFNDIYNGIQKQYKKYPNWHESMSSQNLGHYRASAGEDEKGRYISYIDTYDWNMLPFGKPFNIYDRIYESEF